MIEFVPSPRESARFGLRIGRASVDVLDARDVIAALDREALDVGILRVPSRAMEAIGDLRRYGLAPIVADTRVTYEIDLSTYRPSAGREEAVLRPATLHDAELLESMTREIFSGYASHYAANPLFPSDRILDGYAEWASSHVDPADEAAGAWIVERGDDVVGFSCYRVDAAARLAMGVLNGILPAGRGRGSYRAMLRRMLDHFKGLGMRRFSIATQAHNVAVQHTWTTEGLTLRDVSNTVHINMRRSMADAVLPGEIR